MVAGLATGAGLTGVSAGVVTTVGTGLVVGTGSAAVRGTSAVAGHVIAGSSAQEISEAFFSESVRGFREGFMSGAAGGAARVLGPALGVGTQLSGQVVRRIAAGAIVDGTSAMVETLLQGGSIKDAVAAGLGSAALSVPGSIVGSSGNRLVRELGGPLTAGAIAYKSAIDAGASPEEAMAAAGLAVTSNLAMGRATHGAEADAALEARGRALGEKARAAFPGPVESRRVSSATPIAGVFSSVAAPTAGAPRAGTPTEQPKTPPAVEQGGERVRPAPTAKPKPAPRSRFKSRFTSKDIAHVLGESSEGSAFGSRSPSAREELNVPNVRQIEETSSAPPPQRPSLILQDPKSVARAIAAGVPPEVYQSGTVFTGTNFPDLVPDRPIPASRTAPEIPPEQRERRRGIAGRRPTSAPDPTDVQHTELQADIDLTRRHLEDRNATIHEVAINRTQRSGALDDPRRTSSHARPDLQLAVIDAELNGRRIVIEYDRAPATRAMTHARGILSRDPTAIVIIKIIGFD